MPRVSVEAAGEKATVDYSLAPVATANFDPISVPSLQAYLDLGYGPAKYRRADSKLPNGAPAYVQWPSDKPLDWDIESQHRTMQAGQYLVLPERSTTYKLDMSDGFAAADVYYITDTSLPAGAQEVPISRTWRGKNARTWFSASRTHAGIIGLGPNAKIEPVAMTKPFSRPPQGSDKTMTYTGKYGTSKITGNQEKLIDQGGSEKDGYFGNFTLLGGDFGGVAYHGFVASSGAVVENFRGDRCWRGHGYAPNSETGAFAVGGHSIVRNVTLVATDIGRTSLIMSNRVIDGVVENFRVIDPKGGITRWSCEGADEWTNVYIPEGANINVEANRPGYKLIWRGGSIAGVNYHINLRSPYASAIIELHDVELVGPIRDRLVVNVWASGTEPRLQRAIDIKRFDKAGNPLPVKVVGALAQG